MKEVLLIEGNMASNYMFVTMSCFSESSMLSTCKLRNGAAAIDGHYPFSVHLEIWQFTITLLLG